MAYRQPLDPKQLGALEFIDKIEVTGSAVQDLTFSSSGDGELLHDINGDIDGCYLIKGRAVVSAAGTINWDLRPNNLATNLTREGYTINGGTVTGNNAANALIHSSSILEYFDFEISFDARTGLRRTFRIDVVGFDAGGNGTGTFVTKGTWDETSTLLTSLVLHADDASGWGVGTAVSLYRIREDAPAVPLGAMEFLDRIVTTGAQTTLTFGASGDGEFLHDVNGNEDETYYYTLRTSRVSGSMTPTIRPNGSTTGLETQLLQVNNGAITAAESTTEWALDGSSGFNEFHCTGYIHARTGFRRVLQGMSTACDEPSFPARHRTYSGCWDESVTNITSIDFVDTGGGGGFAAGTVIELYRIRSRPNPKTAAGLSVSGTIRTAAFDAQPNQIERVDPTGGAFAVNLPAVDGSNRGAIIEVKNTTTSTNNITVTADGSDTIDGAATLVMNTSREHVRLRSDGESEWLVVS